MTVLFIGAHPDDEMFAGGTLAKHSRAGDRVAIITLTRGGMGHRTMETKALKALRAKEAHAAASVLGVELRLLDYPDGGIASFAREAEIELAAHIRELRPDLIITLSNETFHPDHNAVHDIALKAVYTATLPKLDLKGLPAYTAPRVLAIADDLYRRHGVYVNIRETIDIKIEAAGCHASQYGDWLMQGGSAIDGGLDTMEYREAFRARARVYGGHCGVEYAEAFDDLLLRRPVALLNLQNA
ncbi:MAG TPA: PIG-L family deacetylase [Armatimonadota bacterium]|jgi:LmbE family N-acetylglucosaminyl deacetylase